MPEGELTAFGFTWGPATIERTMALVTRGRILTIKTEHCEVQVYITEAGRRIRVFPLRDDDEDHVAPGHPFSSQTTSPACSSCSPRSGTDDRRAPR